MKIGASFDAQKKKLKISPQENVTKDGHGEDGMRASLVSTMDRIVLDRRNEE